MTTDEGACARVAFIGDARSRVVKRVGAVCWWAGAVVLSGVLLAADYDRTWWMVLVEAGMVLLPVLFGVSMWLGADLEQSDTERLRSRGLPAVAEIVALELEEQHDGCADRAKLRLAVSGEGVLPFEAVYRLADEPWLRLGLRIKVVVDPSDNLFTLDRSVLRP
ncbi:hypothetical protein [Streptomyces sp. SPB162]|uniref:hypothetical protein n=1 Tax=Streptomyces sp. SPB162 TaxID=2940560 RepID=UPI002406C721|nr:hypothetical protein [Streptomyces sp. SPB162]MDF9811023.1 hypothetical protein [Streptomyces sp. SPB162]